MIDAIELEREPETGPQIGSWRVVASAWGFLGVLLLLMAGVSAAACPRSDSHPHRQVARAVIPQHDPCIGPGIPSAPDIDGCKTIPLNQSLSAYW